MNSGSLSQPFHGSRSPFRGILTYIGGVRLLMYKLIYIYMTRVIVMPVKCIMLSVMLPTCRSASILFLKIGIAFIYDIDAINIYYLFFPSHLVSSSFFYHFLFHYFIFLNTFFFVKNSLVK